jgi:hypothetical protein
MAVVYDETYRFAREILPGDFQPSRSFEQHLVHHRRDFRIYARAEL